MTELARFFEAFVPMLTLSASATDVEQRIGPSPSGSQRLAFYGELARRNRFLALTNVCPALRHAALSQEPAIWHEIVLRYARRQPPAHSDPNEFARKLSEFLGRERENGWAIPGHFEEIADYEFTEWAVGVHPFEPTVDDPGLDRTLVARSYNYDVPLFVAEFRAQGIATLPVAVATPVLIYRHVRTNLPRTFFPTALGLASLGRRAGKRLVLADVSADALEDAERELELHGVLLARN